MWQQAVSLQSQQATAQHYRSIHWWGGKSRGTNQIISPKFFQIWDKSPLPETFLGKPWHRHEVQDCPRKFRAGGCFIGEVEATDLDTFMCFSFSVLSHFSERCNFGKHIQTRELLHKKKERRHSRPRFSLSQSTNYIVVLEWCTCRMLKSLIGNSLYTSSGYVAG